MPYGYRGNSIVRFYDEITKTSFWSRVFQGLFLAGRLSGPVDIAEELPESGGPALPLLGPIANRVAGHRLAGFDVNDIEGDDIRRSLCHKTRRVLDQIAKLGVRTLNTSGYPVIELPLGNADDIDAVGNFRRPGHLRNARPVSVRPPGPGGFRVQVTAANDDSQIDQLNEVLAELCERFRMQRADETV